MPASACPSREELHALLDGRSSAEVEASVAAHVEQCAACRTALESLAAGGGSADVLAKKLREQRVELGPAIRGLLDSMAARQPEASPQQQPQPAADLAFLDPPDGADRIGRLGRYRVFKLLGRGGMGVVFQALDPLLGRVVAIKVLSPQLVDDATARERFLREARAAAAISHANVVTIFAVEEVKGLLLLVMEFVDGVSLQDRLRRNVPFSLPEIVRIGALVAAGLAAAHARGLVHRDVKPANILLSRPADQVKIADFGLARTTDDAGVTLPGAIVGTPAYMAPEQAQGRATDHRADLFSFGSVLYAMCAGRPPYSGDTALVVIRQVADGLPPSLSEKAPSAPPWLVTLVSRLHAVDPADRFQSAAEVGQLFRQQWKALQATGPVAGGELPPGAGPLPIAGGPTAVAVVSAGPAAERTGAAAQSTEKAAASLLIPPLPPNPAVTPPPVQRAPIPPPPSQTAVQWPGPGQVPSIFFRPDTRRHRSKRRYLVFVALGALLLLLPIVLYAIVNRGPWFGNNVGSGDAPETGGTESGRSVPPPIAEVPRRFAVVARDGVARRTFSDWTAAISAAAFGDTLEISGSDAVRIAPFDLHDKALVIRAAAGARPTLAVARLSEPTEAPLMQSEASLAIEGLDIQCGPAEAGAFLPPSLLCVRRAALRLANCRVIHCGTGPALRLEDSPTCLAWNTLFYCSRGSAIDCTVGGPLRATVDNCVLSGYSGLAVHQTGQATDASLELHHDTLVLHEALRVHLIAPLRDSKGEGRTIVHVTASRNLFDTDEALLTAQLDHHNVAETERIARFSRGEVGRNAETRRGKTVAEHTNAAIAAIKKSVAWHSEQDLYSGSGPLLALVSSQNPQKLHALGVPENIAAWNAYWGISKPGMIKLAEGPLDAGTMYPWSALRSKAAAAPQSLSAADYRRRYPGRPLARGGERRPIESRQEGANTAMVGPGEAYEAWKNTIDYRHWLESLRAKKPVK